MQTKKVLLYYPNILGYFRFGLLLYALFIAREAPLLSSCFFILNTLLDAADGSLARYLQQTSAFGAILDYTIDRISVASLFVLLGSVYPEYFFLFSLLLSLDIGSHLFYLQSSHLQNQLSHKTVAATDPFILRLYYNRYALGASCLTHDLFLTCLFLYKFYPDPIVLACLLTAFPGFAFKIIVHLVQVLRASKIMAN